MYDYRSIVRYLLVDIQALSPAQVQCECKDCEHLNEDPLYEYKG
jgi:hypothetical protein